MNKVTLRVLQNSKIRLSLETAGVLACRALQMVLVYLQARGGCLYPHYNPRAAYNGEILQHPL